ncbi:MAG: glycoside hydrolase family 97 protein [Bacteroidales bacterium]
MGRRKESLYLSSLNTESNLTLRKPMNTMPPSNRQKISLVLVSLFFITVSFAQEYKLTSPDGSMVLDINTKETLSLTVRAANEVVASLPSMAMETGSGLVLGKDMRVRKSQQTEIRQTLDAPLSTKASRIDDHYNRLLLQCREDYDVEFRAYDHGWAYRFITRFKEDLTVRSESLDLVFPAASTVWFPEEESLISHYERSYRILPVEEVKEGAFCSLPVLAGREGGLKVLVTESDLDDYPNLFLKKTGTDRFGALHPRRVLKAVADEGNGPDRNEIIADEADDIALTRGTRTFPWRVFVVGTDADLVESTLVWQLASPSKLEDASWIEPGQIAWDWYNANNIYGVDFKSGLTTETYRYFIDFAASKGIRYVILDEGWSRSTTDITASSDVLDVKELIRYGEEKGVRIILWMLWKPLSLDIAGILDLYADWGVAGIKVDFMARADQAMVNYYKTVGMEAAKRKLLVDFHGAYKPTGLHREYPNVITFEGVKGNEHNKWSQDITPDHNLTLPFIRNVAGPMDYTPGAMANANRMNHNVSFDRPVGLGTRCHEIAKYIVFESPLQMLCDSPSRYQKEKECTDFIVQIPQTWDETRVLEARVSDYLVIARRKGQDWFIGGMTDWDAREFNVALDFLEEGAYAVRILRDGSNADRFAEDYRLESRVLDRPEELNISMAPGGGFAAILKKQ